jgi:hypothetical protein
VAGIGGIIGAIAGYKVAEKGIELRNKVFGSIIEGGKESFVEASRNIGTTETEKAEFAETAAQFFDASALATSAAGLIKSGTNAAANLKSKVSAKAAHPVAVREVELAGTGMKVKVPVQEPVVPTEVMAAKKGATPKALAIKERKIDTQERIQRTKGDVSAHLKSLRIEDGWNVKIEGSRKTYTNKNTGEKRWGDFLHNEIECNKGNKSWVIDPITEEIRNKAGHLQKSK